MGRNGGGVGLGGPNKQGLWGGGWLGGPNHQGLGPVVAGESAGKFQKIPQVEQQHQYQGQLRLLELAEAPARPACSRSRCIVALWVDGNTDENEDSRDHNTVPCLKRYHRHLPYDNQAS